MANKASKKQSSKAAPTETVGSLPVIYREKAVKAYKVGQTTVPLPIGNGDNFEFDRAFLVGERQFRLVNFRKYLELTGKEKDDKEAIKAFTDIRHAFNKVLRHVMTTCGQGNGWVPYSVGVSVNRHGDTRASASYVRPKAALETPTQAAKAIASGAAKAERQSRKIAKRQSRKAATLSNPVIPENRNIPVTSTVTENVQPQ